MAKAPRSNGESSSPLKSSNGLTDISGLDMLASLAEDKEYLPTFTGPSSSVVLERPPNGLPVTQRQPSSSSVVLERPPNGLPVTQPQPSSSSVVLEHPPNGLLVTQPQPSSSSSLSSEAPSSTHQNAVEPEQAQIIQNYPCHISECNQVFETTSRLGEHLRRVHHGAKLVLRCDRVGCYAEFEDPSKFRRHIDKHAMRHVCPECGRRFAQNYDLTRHKKIHGAERKYPCLLCEKRFKTQNGLWQHKKIHNKKNK